ncbi:class A beta-lactamase [Streptomyces sp. NPDC087300]|uniref:class A beta-lactamase n=1 Tax=Streptomyces sp. NPDC087300 TaxID=3365780 RepID=UPI00382D6B02
MSSERTGPSRRLFLLAATAVPLAGCGASAGSSSGTDPTGDADRSASPGSSPAPSPLDPSRLKALERKHDARLGVYAVATGTGATLAHRADERFAFCSTFKALAAAAVLDRNPLGHLGTRVTYTRDQVNSISPVTEDHVATGMTIKQLCDAAVRYSDGTAGNLLMRDLGGPDHLTDYLRGLGDTVSRMDQYEPELNRARPGDPRDTTTPRAIAADYRKTVLGDALPAEKRALLKDWLVRSTTGDQRIRAGVPKGWTVAEKTGTGRYGRANDVGIIWPKTGAPLVLAVMSDRPERDARPVDALIAEATEEIVTALT